MTVGDVVRGALKYVSRVIVADDGSMDTTSAVASGAGAEVIKINRNAGKGNALKILFQRAITKGYDAAISMDADGQHNPEEIPKFLAEYSLHPNSIIVGSRMHERNKIPRARYNAMHIARFYVSLYANQFLEDTQCGLRLYPLSLIKNIQLMTEKYVTETELLVKAGDMGTNIRFINIETIYSENGSHFKPILDTTRITAYVISYGYIKWLIEGVTSNNPNTYTPGKYLRDLIGKNRIIDILFQILTALTAPPVTVFFLLEYLFLQWVIPNNFASVRRLGSGFTRITLATHALPLVLITAVIERTLSRTGIKLNLVDRFIKKFFNLGFACVY